MPLSNLRCRNEASQWKRYSNRQRRIPEKMSEFSRGQGLPRTSQQLSARTGGKDEPNIAVNRVRSIFPLIFTSQSSIIRG